MLAPAYSKPPKPAPPSSYSQNASTRPTAASTSPPTQRHYFPPPQRRSNPPPSTLSRRSLQNQRATSSAAASLNTRPKRRNIITHPYSSTPRANCWLRIEKYISSTSTSRARSHSRNQRSFPQATSSRSSTYPPMGKLPSRYATTSASLNSPPSLRAVGRSCCSTPAPSI